MNRYQTSTPRAAIGFVAVAMSALTIGVAVVLPARMQSAGQDAVVFAAAKAAALAPTEVAAVPARIDVIAVRPASAVAGTAPAVVTQRKAQS